MALQTIKRLQVYSMGSVKSNSFYKMKRGSRGNFYSCSLLKTFVKNRSKQCRTVIRRLDIKGWAGMKWSLFARGCMNVCLTLFYFHVTRVFIISIIVVKME
jgi:hypothetical protein